VHISLRDARFRALVFQVVALVAVLAPSIVDAIVQRQG